MANLANLSAQLRELVSTIARVSKHPELMDDIIFYTKTVVLNKHRMERFWRDVEVVEWEGTNSLTSRTLDLTSIPRHRDVLQIAIPGGMPLKKLDLDDVLPNVAKGSINCWYVLGHNLHVRTAAPHTKLLIALLGKPDVRDDTFYSWIAEEYGPSIVEEVSSIIYGTCGQMEKQKLFSDRVRDIHTPELLREELLTDDSAILTSETISGA